MPRPEPKLITFEIDGREVQAPEGMMLVDAAKQGDVEIPYFCYEHKLGKTVTDLLVEHFPKIMDPKFTSHMEEELDDIETRKYKRNDVLNEFYVPFELALKEAEGKLAADAEKCPECGKPLVERFSRFGKFFTSGLPHSGQGVSLPAASSGPRTTSSCSWSAATTPSSAPTTAIRTWRRSAATSSSCARWAP